GKEMVLEGVDTNGNVVDVKDFRDKVVLIKFGTTDYESDIPILKKLVGILDNNGFVFLDYNCRDNREIAKKKAEDAEITWKTLCRSAAYEQKLQDYYNFYDSGRNTFLVGRDGKVIGVWHSKISPAIWQELEKMFPDQADQLSALATEYEKKQLEQKEKYKAVYSPFGLNNDEKENELFQELNSLFVTMKNSNSVVNMDDQALALSKLILAIPDVQTARQRLVQFSIIEILKQKANAESKNQPDTNPAVFYEEMDRYADELLADPTINEIYNNEIVLCKMRILHSLREFVKNAPDKKVVADDILQRYVKIIEKETQHTNPYGGGNLSFFAEFYIEQLENMGENDLLESLVDTVAPIFEKAKDPELHEFAERIRGIQRRVSSVGKELEFECILMNGEKFNLKDYHDKIVLVNIWATWCGPCVREFPNMKTQYEKYKDRGFEMVAYSIDTEVDAIKAFQEKNQYPWLVGSQKLSAEQGIKNYYEFYGSSGVPTTFLVGRDGKVLFRMVGSDDDKLNAALEKAFGEYTGARYGRNASR
ncbi:MAG: TlpA family protein disulfide reductase, partial [Thermoguttaceae bacterium]